MNHAFCISVAPPTVTVSPTEVVLHANQSTQAPVFVCMAVGNSIPQVIFLMFVSYRESVCCLELCSVICKQIHHESCLSNQLMSMCVNIVFVLCAGTLGEQWTTVE